MVFDVADHASEVRDVLVHVDNRCFDMYDAVCGLKGSLNQKTPNNNNANRNVCKRAACWNDGVLVFDERGLLIEVQLDSTASAKLGLDGAFSKEVRLEVHVNTANSAAMEQTWPTYSILATCLATRLKETAGTEAVKVHKGKKKKEEGVYKPPESLSSVRITKPRPPPNSRRAPMSSTRARS
jgi:hypothetical protein